MFTGCSPGVHGIFGFTDFIPNSYTICFPNRMAIKAKPYWQNGGQHVVVNMPSTFPPKPLNGALVSGFVSLDLKRAVQPKSVLSLVQQCGYQVDVDVTKIRSSLPLFYQELRQTLLNRTIAMQQLLDRFNRWTTATFVVTGTDRLLHYQWDERFDELAVSYMQLVDESVGKVLKKCGEVPQVILLSDHGMTKVKKQVMINQVLKEIGVLGFDTSNGNVIGSFNTLTRETLMFSLAPGRIYLNTAGRFPHGHHHIPDDVIRMVKERFMRLQYHGQPVIRKIVNREKVFDGPEMYRAPDFVLIPEDGFLLSGDVNGSGQVFVDPPSLLNGVHTEEAFVSVKNGCCPDTISEVRECIIN